MVLHKYMDTALKSKPDKITLEDMTESYKKYRSVMGTSGTHFWHMAT